MSKKKVQHKGKQKHSAREDEDVPFNKKSSDYNEEEEYVSVVSYEANKKYSKRLIQNNWAKYEAPITDYDSKDDDKEEEKTNDFSFLLKTASSDCSHFQFSSEKLWSEESSIPTSEIFNLDLNILSTGLSCLPFYKRIEMDESELSPEDKEAFDKEAAKNWKEYNELINKTTAKNKSKEDKNLDVSVKKLSEVKISDKTTENTDKGEQSTTSTSETKTDFDGTKFESNLEDMKKKTDNVPNTKKIIFSDNDENLEDWLDSVLDD